MLVWLPSEATELRDAIAEIHCAADSELRVGVRGISSFDWIDHTAVMGRVRRRVGDKRVLALVKASVSRCPFRGRRWRDTITGTPQGGSSHRCWPTSRCPCWTATLHTQVGSARTEWTRAKRRRAGEPVMRLVRYADDFVVMVHGARDDAEALRDESAAYSLRWVCACRKRRRGLPHRRGVRLLGLAHPAPDRAEPARPPSTPPSKKSLASIVKVRQLTRRAKHRTLADLLRRLNPCCGAGATTRHGVSSAPSATSITSPSGGSSAG